MVMVVTVIVVVVVVVIAAAADFVLLRFGYMIMLCVFFLCC